MFVYILDYHCKYPTKLKRKISKFVWVFSWFMTGAEFLQSYLFIVSVICLESPQANTLISQPSTGKPSLSSPMVGKQNLPKAVSPASASKKTQDTTRSFAGRNRGYVPYKGAVKPLKDRTELKDAANRTHKAKSRSEAVLFCSCCFCYLIY